MKRKCLEASSSSATSPFEPDHRETHGCRRADGVERGPSRLIDDPDVLHLQCHGRSVGTDLESAIRNRDDPVQTGSSDGWVKIVHLVCGSRRPPKQSESYVCKRARDTSSTREVLALHQAEVCCWAAERQAGTVALGPLPGEGASAGHLTLEVKDVRGLQLWTCRLIVIAVLVQPRNRERVRAAIRGTGLAEGQGRHKDWNRRE